MLPRNGRRMPVPDKEREALLHYIKGGVRCLSPKYLRNRDCRRAFLQLIILICMWCVADVQVSLGLYSHGVIDSLVQLVLLHTQETIGDALAIRIHLVLISSLSELLQKQPASILRHDVQRLCAALLKLVVWAEEVDLPVILQSRVDAKLLSLVFRGGRPLRKPLDMTIAEVEEVLQGRDEERDEDMMLGSKHGRLLKGLQRLRQNADAVADGRRADWLFQCRRPGCVITAANEGYCTPLCKKTDQLDQKRGSIQEGLSSSEGSADLLPRYIESSWGSGMARVIRPMLQELEDCKLQREDMFPLDMGDRVAFVNFTLLVAGQDPLEHVASMDDLQKDEGEWPTWAREAAHILEHELTGILDTFREALDIADFNEGMVPESTLSYLPLCVLSAEGRFSLHLRGTPLEEQLAVAEALWEEETA
ncbi:unnamed protein product [Chrysoparadoxa australica]